MKYFILLLLITLTACMSEQEADHIKAKYSGKKYCYQALSKSNPDVNGKYCLEYIGE